MAHIAYMGESLATRLADIVVTHNPKHIFLVTGRESFMRSGAQSICDAVLVGRNVTMFSDFSANPKLEDIEKGIAVYRDVQPDMVIAIGGGSAIDIAKAINMLSVQEGKPAQYIEGETPLTRGGAPLVAVPTTAGTGSEATHFAALYIGAKKYSLAHESMLPDYAIVDEALTHSLSPRQTTLSGLDALCQAFESLWSIHATPESQNYAREAMALILSNIRTAVTTPTLESRVAMVRGAHLAGKAINISKTTACHAMSYALTITYNIPHGHAVALTFPELLVFNDQVTDADVTDTRGVAYVRGVIAEIVHALGVTDAESGASAFRTLMQDVGLTSKLGQLGVHETDIDALVAEMSIERAGNNPRRFTQDDARRVLTNIL